MRPGVDVETQLELPGLPVLGLVGVLYHDGPDFNTGHYTCLCRGPRGRFWMYDDSKAVRIMDGEVAHIKPKQVYMLVYARREGDALWQSGAVPDVGDGSGRAERSGSGLGVVASSGVAPGALGSATGAGAGTPVVVGSPGSARRKLGRKTSEADWVRSGSGDGVCASPLIGLETTPERQVKRARMSACGGLSGAGADAGGFKTRRVTQEGSGSEDPGGVSSVARQVPTPERLAEFEGDDEAAMDEAHASASSGTVLGGEESCARGFGARGAAGRGRCRTGRGDQAAGGAKRGAGQPLRRSARIALRQESRSAGSGGVGPAQRQSGRS